MDKCFLRFGAINHKLIVPFILLILSIIHIIYINYVLQNKANVIVTEISSSFGHMLIIIIPYIKCFSVRKGKNTNNSEKNKKNYFKDYFIFLSTHLINLLLLFACSQLKPHSTKNNNIIFLSSDVHGLYCIGSIEIVFIIILSFFILDTHHYVHHYLSLFFFIIISIVIDFILDNFHYEFNLDFFLYLIAFIGQLFVESLNLTYQKYMFDVLYYSPYRTCFAFGVLFLLYNLGTIGVFLLAKKYEFIDYFKEENLSIGYEIIKFISNIFMVFFLYTSMALTNFHFSPNHLIANSELADMIIYLLKSDSSNKYYAIILFVFQFILLLVFLELLELNFCGLNKNTKRSIRKRADDDISNEVQHCESKIELIAGYIFGANESIDKKETEMSIPINKE